MSPFDVRLFSKSGIGSVDSYAIDLPDRVILIDGQRELSSARAALSVLSPDGKPVAAVFLTHPHPDHFGGIGAFVEAGGGCLLYSSQHTHDSIAEDRMGFVAKSREMVGDDFPETVPLPDRILAPAERLELDGLTIETREFGAGEAECVTVLYLPQTGDLFSADIVQNGMTAFLLEGRIDAWLGQIDSLRQEFPDMRTLHPGHGDSGAPNDLLNRQREYLSTFRRLVGEELTDGRLNDGAEDRITGRMEDLYPGYLPVAAIPDLLRMDIAPVAEALRERS